MSRILIFLLIASITALAALEPTNESGCSWRGTAPLCNGQCTSDETLAATDQRGDGLSCLVGKKRLCCPSQQCAWRGEAPFCTASCEAGEHAVVYDEVGPTGSAACLTGKKVLCCTAVPTDNP